MPHAGHRRGIFHEEGVGPNNDLGMPLNSLGGLWAELQGNLFRGGPAFECLEGSPSKFWLKLF